MDLPPVSHDPPGCLQRPTHTHCEAGEHPCTNHRSQLHQQQKAVQPDLGPPVHPAWGLQDAVFQQHIAAQVTQPGRRGLLLDNDHASCAAVVLETRLVQGSLFIDQQAAKFSNRNIF